MVAISRWNIRSGLFRLWTAMSVLWIIVNVALFYSQIKNEILYINLSLKNHSELTYLDVIKINEIRIEKGCASILYYEEDKADKIPNEQVAEAISKLNIFDCLPADKNNLILGIFLILFGLPIIILFIFVSVIKIFSWIVSGFVNT
jgi:hypothetical protein